MNDDTSPEWEAVRTTFTDLTQRIAEAHQQRNDPSKEAWRALCEQVDKLTHALHRYRDARAPDPVREELVATLVDAQWGNDDHCPWCDQKSRQGHTADCRIKLALEMTTK